MNIFFLLISLVGFFAAHQPVYCMNKRSIEDPLSKEERRLIEQVGNHPSAVPSRRYVTNNIESYDSMAYVQNPLFNKITEDKKTFRKLMNEKKYGQALLMRKNFGSDDPEVLHCAALAEIKKGNFQKGQLLLKSTKEPRLLWTGFKNGSFYEQYFVYDSHQKPKIVEQKQRSLNVSTNNSSSSCALSPIGSISPTSSPEPLNQKALVPILQPTFDMYKYLKKGLKQQTIQRALSQAYISGDDESLFMRAMDLVEAFGKLSEKDQKNEVGIKIQKLAQGAIERVTQPIMPSENEVRSYARYRNKLRKYDDELPVRRAAIALQSVQVSDQEKKFIQEATLNAALVVAQAAADNQITSNAPAKFDQYVPQGKKEKSEDLHEATLNAVEVLASHFNAIQETSAAQSTVGQFVAKVLTPAEALQNNRAMMDSFKTLLSKNQLSVSDARKLIEYKRDDDIEYDITQEENDQLAGLLEKQLEEKPRETARLLRYLESKEHQLSLPAIIELVGTKKIDADTQNYLQGLHFMSQPGSVSYAIQKLEAIKSEKRIEALPYLVNCYLAIPVEKRTEGENGEDDKAEKCLSELCSYIEESLSLQKKGELTGERLELSRQLAYEVAFAPASGQQATDKINNSILELQGLYLGLINPAMRAQALDLYARDYFGLLKQEKLNFDHVQKYVDRIRGLQENVAQPTPIADLLILELQRRISLKENKDDLRKHSEWLRDKSDELQKFSQELKTNEDRKYASFVVARCNEDLDSIDYHVGNQHLLKKEYDKAILAYEKVGTGDLATFIKARSSMAMLKKQQSKNIDDYFGALMPAIDLILAHGLKLQLETGKLQSLKNYYQESRIDTVLSNAIEEGKDQADYIKTIFDCSLDTNNLVMKDVSTRFERFLQKAILSKDSIWQTRIIATNLALLARRTEQAVLSKPEINRFNELCNKLEKLSLGQAEKLLTQTVLNEMVSMLANAKEKTNQNERLIEKIKDVAKKQQIELLLPIA